MEKAAFEAIAGIIPEGLILLDADYHVLAANRAATEILGRDGDALIGVSLPEISSDRDALEAYLRSARRSTTMVPGRLGLGNGGSSEEPLRVDAARVMIRDTDLRILVMIRSHASSVSEFTELQEKIDELAAEISHRRRIERLIDAQKEALAAVMLGKPMSPTFDRFLKEIDRFLGSGTASSLYAIDEDTGDPVMIAAPSMPEELRSHLVSPREITSASENIQRLADGDTEWSVAAGRHGFILGSDVRLTGADQETIGFFRILTRERPQSLEDVNDAISLAGKSAAIALRNRRAEREVRRALQIEREAREKAEESDRMKSEFIAMISHELRTPLTSILGWIHLLTHDAHPEELEQGLATIERSARAQSQLVEDLLDASRLSTGRMVVQRVPVNLIPVIRSAATTIRPAAADRDIRVTAVMPEKIGLVSGDPYRLHQIVWNLLTNAIKFSPTGSEVVMELRAEGGKAKLSVSDQGKGISPEFMPKLFSRFTQAESVFTRSEGGLGLGLAIVKELVELHEGEIDVNSTPGVGTTFTVTLPLLAEGTVEEYQQPSAELVNLRGDELSGTSILLVEDDEPTRDFLETLLRKAGALVYPAGSVTEAMGKYIQHRPNVLLTDIGLPGQSGNDLLKGIRLNRLGMPDVTIAISAYLREEEGFAAIDDGFHTFLAKPVSPRVLLAEIRTRMKAATGGEIPDPDSSGAA